VALAWLAPPLPGRSASAAAPATDYGDSFVDVDDDGVWTPGTDVLLSDVIGPDGDGFDVDQSYPNWTPQPTPVGVVLAGKLKLPTGLGIDADTIIVDGSLTGYDDGSNIHLYADDTLRLTARSKITNVGALDLFGAQLAELGDRVKLVSKEDGFMSVHSSVLTRVGEKVMLQTGNLAEYADVYISSDAGIEAAAGLRFKGARYAAFELRAENGDLALDRFNFRGHDLYVYAYGGGVARYITMTNSYVAAKGEDAGISMWTGPGPGSVRPPDAITLTGTKFSAPICDFTPSQPPIQGCGEQY